MSGARKSSGTLLMGGLRLVHPDVTSLHNNAALRSLLGVQEFSPKQLIGIVKVRPSYLLSAY